MDILKKYGLSDDDIKEIIDYNDKNVIDNINHNSKNVEDILDYLLGIGINITTIKEMLMYQIGLLHKTKDEIKISFDEYEIDSIIKSLNYDINNVELIEFF